MDLALDLARLGASPELVLAVGGEDAVSKAAAGNGNGAHP
jgi:hypothetical protein